MPLSKQEQNKKSILSQDCHIPASAHDKTHAIKGLYYPLLAMTMSFLAFPFKSTPLYI